MAPLWGMVQIFCGLSVFWRPRYGSKGVMKSTLTISDQ